ncbi:hypothetical protein EV189_2977 [Motilibacter rhizosphaerae]|uniref:DUF1989 domain-containing protein n=1 Tax=Motilibacter rhizosphaerae TaxID=598652 RepID=A0A4Q7NR83_9ACTN|nr:urea amidolyase associated protein UAAP1 [Motilibacter rhizosphaerae]RZS87546.1 hypothetical protein EV189_2977 [Motilibacter rhizosphaerae]
MSTATTAGARAHARSMAGTVVEAMPVLPATAAAPPAGVDAIDLVRAETVAGGGYTSLTVARGTTLRLEDLTGDACAHVVLLNAAGPHERLNIADTVKVLWQAYVTTGHLLLSDQGRVLASVVTDTSGRHDTFCGTSTKARNEQRYGDGTAFGPTPAGRELLTLAAAKHGLSKRDLPPSMAFFQGVRVDSATGTFAWLGSAGRGAVVELRAEMDLHVLLANVPHPLDPRATYETGPLRLHAWRGEPTRPGDELWGLTPEGERAFLNTQDYLAARGIS